MMADSVTIEFTLYQIDEWTPEDKFSVVINGVTIDLGEMVQNSTSVPLGGDEQGITWQRQTSAQGRRPGLWLRTGQDASGELDRPGCPAARRGRRRDAADHPFPGGHPQRTHRGPQRRRGRPGHHCLLPLRDPRSHGCPLHGLPHCHPRKSQRQSHNRKSHNRKSHHRLPHCHPRQPQCQSHKCSTDHWCSNDGSPYHWLPHRDSRKSPAAVPPRQVPPLPPPLSPLEAPVPPRRLPLQPPPWAVCQRW